MDSRSVELELLTTANLLTTTVHEVHVDDHDHDHDHGHHHHEGFIQERTPVKIAFEVIFLLLLAVVGTLGNLMLILSVTLQKRAHKNGNIFLINLAAADLVICSICVPAVVANVLMGTNALPAIGCKILGYMTIVCWANSLSNIAFIAANRYWAVVRYESHPKVFSNRNMIFMVVVTWIWANLLVLPVFTGFSELEYDAKMQICLWHDSKNPAFNTCMMVAIFLPVVLIIVFYWRLMHSVRKRGKWVRRISSCPKNGNTSGGESGGGGGGGKAPSNGQGGSKRSLRKEIDLMKTLGATVTVFVLLWLPYALMLAIDPNDVPAVAEQVVAWLALSSSAMNFIVYGVVNPVYRRGYKRLFRRACRCHKLIPGSDPDSSSNMTMKPRKATVSSLHGANCRRITTPQRNYGFRSEVSRSDANDLTTDSARSKTLI